LRPVLVRDRRTACCCRFHAGWRGTLKAIVKAVLGKSGWIRQSPEELEAAIGPAIWGCCYAVGEEVRSEFCRSQLCGGAVLEVYDSDR